MAVGFFISLKTLNFLSSSILSLVSDFLPLTSLSIFCHSNAAEIQTLKKDDTMQMQGSNVSSFSVGEMNVVMTKLGLRTELGAEDRDVIMKGCELEGVFEEEEPSLEELRDAFHVFDENRDGFIDAMELGRVLYRIGLIKGLSSDNYDVIMTCENIIRGFDSNGDGLLDFRDFIKVIELSLN